MLYQNVGPALPPADAQAVKGAFAAIPVRLPSLVNLAQNRLKSFAQGVVQCSHLMQGVFQGHSRP